MSTPTPDVSLREKADTPAPKEASTPAEWTEQLDSLHLRSKPDSFMGRLLSERKSLLSRVERAEADSKRLDWLERTAWSESVGNGIAILPYRGPGDETGISLADTGDGGDSGDGDLGTAQTLRAAIDDAASYLPTPEVPPHG